MKSFLGTSITILAYLGAFLIGPLWIIGSLFFTLLDKDFNFLSLEVWGISVCLFVVIAIIRTVKDSRKIK